MRRFYEKGSTIELVIIGVLVVAVAGLLAWKFMGGTSSPTNAADTSAKTNTVASNTGSSATPTKEEPTKTGTPEVDLSKYLVLDDWGVKFPLLQDGTTVMYRQYSFNGGIVYGFTTKAVDALGERCKQSTTDAATNLVIIQRQKEKITQAVGLTDLNNGQKLGDYYYYMSSAQGGCSEQNTKLQNDDWQKMRSFGQSIQLK